MLTLGTCLGLCFESRQFELLRHSCCKWGSQVHFGIFRVLMWYPTLLLPVGQVSTNAILWTNSGSNRTSLSYCELFQYEKMTRLNERLALSFANLAFTQLFTLPFESCQSLNPPTHTCNGICFLSINQYNHKAPFPSFSSLQIANHQIMSFFPSSSGFIINGGTFTSISLPTQDAGRFYFHFKPYY